MKEFYQGISTNRTKYKQMFDNVLTRTNVWYMIRKSQDK